MANLFAQNTANYDAANQWNTAANGSGSNQTPTTGDVLMANGKTVTINIDFNIGSGTLKNDTTGGATTGGGFTCSTTRTVTANLTAGGAALFTFTGAAGTTLTLNGNILGGGGFVGLTVSNTGAVNITGNVGGGSAGAGSHGISITGAAAVSVSGTVTGGTGTSTSTSGIQSTAAASISIGGLLSAGTAAAGNARGMSVATASTVLALHAVTGTAFGPGLDCTSLTASGTITGDVNGGSVVAINWAGNGGMTITGNVNAGATTCISAAHASGNLNIIGNLIAAGGSALVLSTAGTVNITGNVDGSPSASVAGLQVTGNGAANITGTVTGGAGGGAAYGAILSAAGGTLNVFGSAVGTPSNSGAAGVAHNSTGTCYVQIAKANDYPNSSITLGATGISQITTGGWITVDAQEDGSGGWPAAALGRTFVRDAGTNYVKMRQANAGSITTMGELANDYPSTSNVRSGVSYDFGAMVGTCAVPAAGSVALGVAIDNTTGTAALSPAALLGSADFVTRLNNVLTVQAAGEMIAAVSP